MRHSRRFLTTIDGKNFAIATMLFASTISATAFAVDRISSINKDLSSVKSIYFHAGLVNAYKVIDLFVVWSLRLCGILGVCLRSSLGHALISITFLLVLMSSPDGVASVNRISAISNDLSQVKKIYLHAGLVSTVEFTQPVWGVKIGNPQSIKAEISPSNPKEITLRLKYQSAEPTNMIVRIEKRVMVFDLIPSRVSHQDYIKIRGSYGAPEWEPVGAKERSKISAGVNDRHADDEGVRSHSRAQGPKLVESVKLGGG